MAKWTELMVFNVVDCAWKFGILIILLLTVKSKQTIATIGYSSIRSIMILNSSSKFSSQTSLIKGASFFW